MVKIIKLRKGLDIKLAGEAEKKKMQLKPNGKFSLAPADFVGVTQKVVVKEGDKVIYSKYAGTEIKVEDDEYVIVSESDIIAVVEQ